MAHLTSVWLGPGERGVAGRWQGQACTISSRLSLPGHTGREESSAAAGCAEVSGAESPFVPFGLHITGLTAWDRIGPTPPWGAKHPDVSWGRGQGGSERRVDGREGYTELVGRRSGAVPRPLGGVGSPPLGGKAAGPSPSQYEEKDKVFKEQLSHLATLLPTLQVRGAGPPGPEGPLPRPGTEQCPSTGSPGHRFLLPQLGQQGRVPGSGLRESPLPSSCGVYRPHQVPTLHLRAWWPVPLRLDQGSLGSLLLLLHTTIYEPVRGQLNPF